MTPPPTAPISNLPAAQKWRAESAGATAVWSMVVALGYFAAGKAGLALFPMQESMAVMWPSDGIAVAALLLLGARMLPAVFAGAVALSLGTGAGTAEALMNGTLTSACTGIAYALMVYAARLDPGLRRVQDAIAFLLCGVVVVALLKGLGIAAWLALNGTVAHAELLTAWVSGLAAGFGVLVVTPALLTWSTSVEHPLPQGRRIEALALAITSVVLALVLFDDRFVPMIAAAQAPYALFPLMFWAGTRFGPREVAGVLLVTGIVAVWCTAVGIGPFAQKPLLEGLVSLYLFVAVLGATGLMFAAGLHQRVAADRARRRAEEQARQHLQQLAHVSRVSSMGEMASAIAHEINQPLTAIANYAYACVRLLRSGATTQAEALEAMIRVAAEAERAGEVVRKMRSFVRGDEGQASALDVNYLVREVLLLAAPEARQSGVVLEVDLGENLPAVFADSIQIQQVLLNLVRNAVEAISSEDSIQREVRIATRRTDPGAVEITVTDTGPGVPEADLERVFEPFHTTKPDGVGIGLALSRSIADAHSGKLWASLRAGGGAAFHLRLPAAEASRTDG